MAVAQLCLATMAAGSNLADKIEPLLNRHEGQVSVAIRHLDSKESYYFRADRPMPTASLIKVAVMVEAYRQVDAGIVAIDDLLTLREEDRVPGSGILTTHFSTGAQLTLQDAIRLMIAFSDNTATNLIIDHIRLASVSQQMEALGLHHTRLHSKVFRRDTSLFPKRSERYGLGSTTAREMLLLFEKLYRRELVRSEACEAMLDHLFHCEDRTKLARDLPPEVKIAHKSGAVSRARCDAGIILSDSGPIGICVLTSENGDRQFAADNAAHILCGRIARTTFEHFNVDVTATLSRSRHLRVGDVGKLVEDLQRTLNERLSPSPMLAVDGDFGPLTESAVKGLQRQEELPVTGEVDKVTWAALGPLLTQDKPVPSPADVNAQQLPVSPADLLTGLPYVTCKAWAVADAATGKILWSKNENQPLDIASTTKIMTAYVVLKLALSRPDVLNEEMVFSTRADQTIGSTAGIRSGERLPVGEALYGLLLPSGNDASVALAEHFGSTFSSAVGDSEEHDPLALFVSQMNREAVQLGMTNSHYENPHGLTAKGHRASAGDLIKLAHAAWQLPAFRRYVSTRQYGYSIAGPGGYQRNLLWKNTNRLLAIDGYDGIKTGTTSAAGACLVSTAERSGERLYLVVLGSSSSAARYADSRNLYRWAWNQRASASPGR